MSEINESGETVSGKKESDNLVEAEGVERVVGDTGNVEISDLENEMNLDLTPASQIDELLAQLKQAEEDVLRAKAQEQNTQRRAALDVDKARKFALESFVKELLPVVDNLERALASMNPDQQGADAFVEGVELTLKSLIAALEKNRVTTIDPIGESFNPELHQAMAIIENADVEPNTVIEVFQKGYELNGRLIRPAMVVVSKSA